MMKNCTQESEAYDLTPDQILRDLKYENLEKQLRAMSVIHSMLLQEDLQTAAAVHEGIIPALVDALDRDDCPNFRYPALGVLTIIAFWSPKHAEAVLHVRNSLDLFKAFQQSGAIPKLMPFLALEGDLAVLSILVLGNFALLGPEARGLVLRLGAVPAMLPHLRPGASLKRRRTFVRVYSSLCSYHDETSFALLSPALPYICEILDMKDEEPEDEDNVSQQQPTHKPHTASDIVEAACTALTNLTYGPNEHIEAIQAIPTLTTRLVALLEHESCSVKEAALDTIGNMLAGTDEQVDRCLEAGCLQHVASLLRSSNPSLVQEAARAAANVLAGTHAHIHRALEAGVLTALQDALAGGDAECQKQAARAVTRLCYSGTGEQRARLIASGVMERYCALLVQPDCATAGEVLDGLYELLQSAERDGNVTPLCYILDECDVLDQITLLQENGDEDHDYKIANMMATLRKHAREERFIVHEEKEFTADIIVREMESQQQAMQTQAARAACCMLREQNPPINALLEAGIMAALVAGLDKDACSDFQNAAAFVLSRITGGTRKHRMAVANSGALPKLIGLLVHGDETAALAASALGNMALHGPEAREALVAYTQTHSETALSELRIYVRSFMAMCSLDKHESMMLKSALLALPFVAELLDCGDTQILKEVCLACTALMVGLGDSVVAVPGLPARLVALLAHEADAVKHAALMGVINMSSNTATQVERCIDDSLGYVIALLRSSEPSLVKGALLSTTNILLHTHLIQRALDKGILAPLRNILIAGETDHIKQAASIVTNLCMEGSAAQHDHLVSSGVLEPYCKLLAQPDRAIVVDVVYGVGGLILSAMKIDAMKPLCLYLHSLGILDPLQQLQEQEIHPDIRLRAVGASVALRRHARKEHLVIEGGGILTLADIVQALKSQELSVQKRGVRAANRMLCLPVPPRTKMVQAGIVEALVAVLDSNDSPSLQQDAAGALSNFTSGSLKHRLAVLNAGAIPKLIAIIARGGKAADPAAVVLADISFRAPNTRDLVLAQGVVEAMLPHLRPGTPLDLLRRLVWTYWNLCTHIISPSMFELVLPALPWISRLMDLGDQEILRYSCEAISNLILNLDERIEAVQAVPGLTARLVALLGHEAADVKKAALSAVVNMLCLTKTQVDCCLDLGCLEHVVPLLQSNEPSLVEYAVVAAGNMLRSPPHIQRALTKDIFKQLLDIFLQSEANSFLQYYVVCAVTNITAHGTREHKMDFVKGGALPKLVALLSLSPAVVDPAIKALANIARVGPEARDLVLAEGTVLAMLPHLCQDAPLDLLSVCVWAYTHFCRYDDEKQADILKFVSPALPHISKLLEIGDETILMNASWSLVELMKTSDGIDVVQAVPGLLARLLALLGHEAPKLKTVTIKAAMLMLSGTDAQVERCLAANSVEHLISFLQCKEPSLMQAAAEVTRAALGVEHPRARRALQEDNLTPLMMILGCPPKGQIRTVRGITNLFCAATAAQRTQLELCGVLEPYCALLAQRDHAAAGEALASLGVMLQVADSDGSLDLLRLKLDEIGVFDQMKLLQQQNDQDGEKAGLLLHAYFPGETS